MDKFIVTSSIMRILDAVLAPYPINKLRIVRRLRVIAAEVGADEPLVEALDAAIMLMRRNLRAELDKE
jgi:hypothetical protein